MYVPFETLPGESRIWIYQSNRKFADDEVAVIEAALKDFIDNWAAHGTPLEASYLVQYNRFIIIAVNQEVQNVTGCSVDASVHLIQELERKFGVELLDKMNVTFRMGEHIAHKTLMEFRKMVKDKSVSANTIVFNNLVNNIDEWQDYWEVPAGESWHSRFF